MDSMLRELIGQPVMAFDRVQDYWQLHLGNATLNIMTSFRIRDIASGTDTILKLGSILQSASQTDDALTLTFTGGVELEIDLRDEAYRGPEALIYYRSDGTAVIW